MNKLITQTSNLRNASDNSHTTCCNVTYIFTPDIVVHTMGFTNTVKKSRSHIGKKMQDAVSVLQTQNIARITHLSNTMTTRAVNPNTIDNPQ